MKFIIPILFLCLYSLHGFSQAGVGVNTNGAAADVASELEVLSTDKGLLIPRIEKASRDTFTNVPAGLMIYNSTDKVFNYYNGTAWIIFPVVRISGINDLDADTDIQTETSADEDILRFSTGQSGAKMEVAAISKTGIDVNASSSSKYYSNGDVVLAQNKLSGSVASGAGAYPNVATVTGQNTVVGGGAFLAPAVSSTGNTVLGSGSAASLTGDNNTVAGSESLIGATSAADNTVLGSNSAIAIVSGSGNTVIGNHSATIATGDGNIVVGNTAASNITSANGSIVIGDNTNARSATEDSTLNIGDVIFADLKSKEVSFNEQYSFTGEGGENGELLVLNSSGRLDWSGRTSQQVAGAMADMKPFDLVMADPANAVAVTQINYVRVNSFATAEIAYIAANIVVASASDATLYFGIYNLAGDSLVTVELPVLASTSGQVSVELPAHISVTSGDSYFLALYCTDPTITFLQMPDANNVALTEAFSVSLPDIKNSSGTQPENVWINAY